MILRAGEVKWENLGGRKSPECGGAVTPVRGELAKLKRMEEGASELFMTGNNWNQPNFNTIRNKT